MRKGEEKYAKWATESIFLSLALGPREPGTSLVRQGSASGYPKAGRRPMRQGMEKGWI